MKRYIAEFKAFAVKGSVLDLAVGVIIGAAFGKIIDSLVTDVIMPVLGIIVGGIDFTQITFGFNNAQINTGLFIQALLNFVLVALSLFIFIKFINKFKKENKEKENTEKPISEEVKLLTEIRDSLKK